jgi:hypothetical protein
VTPREVFEALVAGPREAGTAAATEARALLTEHLTARGYDVRAQPFTFQPASVNVLPVVGTGLGWLTLLEIPALLLSHLPAWLAPFIWFAGLTALGILAWGIGTGVEIPGAERRQDANLVVTRGAAPVRRWIVAHVDTKAQRHSLAGRLIAVWVLLLAVAVMSVLVVTRGVLGAVPAGGLVSASAGLTIAAGVLATRGRLAGGSPGARDNGTGLLAALVAAAVPREDGIGYLFTGAEEFGLLGARTFVRSGVPLHAVEVLNLDTLTARGTCYVLSHNAGGRNLGLQLRASLERIAASVRVRRLPLGILVDSLPFAGAGARAVTLSRLDWADLRRIHTAGDTIAELDPATAEAVGAVLAELR